MNPILLPHKWHYCSVAECQLTQALLASSFAVIRESESITLILPPKLAASVGQAGSMVFQRIELQVYSSLEAVGLTAAVSQCLTAQNISANIIAGFHHDHVFVPENHAQQALKALQSLINNA